MRESPRRLARKVTKRQSAEQIVVKLRQAELELGKGLKVPEVARLPEVSEQTYYRWRMKYGELAQM